jgi:hypothetical protein
MEIDIKRLAQILVTREIEQLMVSGAMATECMPIAQTMYGSDMESTTAIAGLLLYRSEVSRLEGRDMIMTFLRMVQEE